MSKTIPALTAFIGVDKDGDEIGVIERDDDPRLPMIAEAGHPESAQILVHIRAQAEAVALRTGHEIREVRFVREP